MAEGKEATAQAQCATEGARQLGQILKITRSIFRLLKMENKRRLAYSIIQYLHDQLQHGDLSPDAQESLDASIQCLETAFEVTVEDKYLAVSQTLPEMFEAVTGIKEIPSVHGNSKPIPHRDVTTTEAERLKTEGNEQMKMENFEAAVSFYGKAIELNPANAVYFCNRAAAYSKLGNYAGAVEDCEKAIGINPYYSKAYGRMALALSSLKKYKEAVGYYKKALKLDPDNDTYKTNLKVAEQKMKEVPSAPGGTVGCNLAGLLNNSSFRSVASNLMNNPQIRQIMSGIMSSGHSTLGGSRATRSPNASPSFIQRGQQFAQQMQQQNPDLIEELRSQIRNRNPSTSKDKKQE
ncbi:small glutamine-rich tetratricopeptide repeat-containing protein alpha-like [Sarcophilus harrisii]|uniref:Small glutamine-rich tetratricopeptide repeat-containing protein alpha n=1 Tax=Sarcophilus harrisii TaxID=9305 RepID=G3WGY0_SARHA